MEGERSRRGEAGNAALKEARKAATMAAMGARPCRAQGRRAQHRSGNLNSSQNKNTSEIKHASVHLKNTPAPYVFAPRILGEPGVVHRDLIPAIVCCRLSERNQILKLHSRARSCWRAGKHTQPYSFLRPLGLPWTRLLPNWHVTCGILDPLPPFLSLARSLTRFTSGDQPKLRMRSQRFRPRWHSAGSSTCRSPPEQSPLPPRSTQTCSPCQSPAAAAGGSGKRKAIQREKRQKKRSARVSDLSPFPCHSLATFDILLDF